PAILNNVGAARPPGCAVNQNRLKATRNASHRKSSLPNQTTRRLEGRIHCKGRVAIASHSKLGASKTRIAVSTLPPMLGMITNRTGITMSSEKSKTFCCSRSAGMNKSHHLLRLAQFSSKGTRSNQRQADSALLRDQMAPAFRLRAATVRQARVGRIPDRPFIN